MKWLALALILAALALGFWLTVTHAERKAECLKSHTERQCDDLWRLRP